MCFKWTSLVVVKARIVGGDHAAAPLNRHFFTLLVPLAEQRGGDASFVLGT